MAAHEGDAAAPPVPRWFDRVASRAIGVLLLAAIAVMLTGVFLRYVLADITDWLDLDSVSYFWVEEVGEFLLAWLTLIGAAVGIGRHAHFTLPVLAHRLPPAWQRRVAIGNALLIAGFGLLVAATGWALARQNAQSWSPGLEINLFWLYFAAVAGGALTAVYAGAAALRAWRAA